MPTHEWARHADAIEDVRDEGDIALLRNAIEWALDSGEPEADDLCRSLFEEFQVQGNSNQASCRTNRALEIILDAYLDDQKQEKAA